MTAAQFLSGIRGQPMYRTLRLVASSEPLLLAGGYVGAVRSRLVRLNGAGVPGSTVRAALANADWQSEGPIPTVSDSAVIMVCAPHGEAGVLKVATSPSGVASLRREHDTLHRLHSDERLGAWRGLLPVPLQTGDADGGVFLLLSRLPGQDARHVPPERSHCLTLAAVDAIAPLHSLAAAVHVVSTELLSQIVDEPAERLRKAVRCTDPVDRLVAVLHTQLAGRLVLLGWTHGDFHPGNVLVSTDRQVTGIVDWSQTREHDLVLLDLAYWLLMVPARGQQREFGARVAARLGSDQAWRPAEYRMLARHMGADPISGRALLLLTWLRHVTDNLAQSNRYSISPIWSRRNIAPVLSWVAERGPATAWVQP